MQVELKQIGKAFFTLRGHVQALKNIDLTIKDGEFFVLLGPSGCGKSTLLNIIAGLEKATAGKILFNHRLVADASRKLSTEARQRNVAFVFQTYALYPHLNVFHNIGFPLKIAGCRKSEIATRVRRTAERLDITGLLAAKPAELSGGQRQRVAIARAIVRQPNVFLLDEPLSNLDARLRTAMRAELKELQEKLGTTTVYVTHDQTEAMALGQRIALLKGGTIQQLGTPDNLYENPCNMFAAKFIGSPPMNFIPASLNQDRQSLRLQVGTSTLVPPPERQAQLKQFDASEFELGIRPEDITINHGPPDNHRGNSIPARIQAVEPLGRETFVHCKLEQRELTIIQKGQEKLTTGQAVEIVLDMQKIHAFKKTEDDTEAVALW